MSGVTWLQLVVVLGLLTLVYWDVLRGPVVGRWIEDDNWSHGWLIPVFSLYFLHANRAALLEAHRSTAWTGLLLLVGSLAIFFVSGWILRLTYPQAISIIGAMLGIALLLGGWQVIRVLWFPIVFLALAVPLPKRLYFEWTMPLREYATKVASAVLPILVPGLYTESQAVVIDYILPGADGIRGRLNVEEACSGMRLMMAFVTLGVAMAYLKKRPVWQRIILVLSCLPISILCNAIRVTVTGLLHVHGLTEWAQGTPHELLGLAMLVLALGLFALLAYILEHLFVDAADDATDREFAS
jgi:exosortase